MKLGKNTISARKSAKENILRLTDFKLTPYTRYCRGGNMYNLESLLIKDLKKTIYRLFKREEERDRVWTNEIKRSLVKLGKKFGYESYAAPQKKVGSKYGEWLYDLCWAKQIGKKWEGFKGLVLIMESEWQNNEDAVLEDFLKLTVGIAKCRLMIIYYNERKDGTGKKWLNKVIQRCKNSCPPNKKFHYLIFAVPEYNRERGVIKHWVK